MNHYGEICQAPNLKIQKNLEPKEVEMFKGDNVTKIICNYNTFIFTGT